MRKKRILIHSNYHKAFTGFGKNSKNILNHLFKSNKYDIFELANGFPYKKLPEEDPWPTYGSLCTDPKILKKINDPYSSNQAAYGSVHIDDVLKIVKPDIYIGIEDIWAFREISKKPWWNKINCMIWTTLDSLPILKDAVEIGKKTNHFYCWSSFAEKACKEIGVEIKTLHGSINPVNFYKLNYKDKLDIRKKHNINKKSFVVGFVFRNQLRKTVGDLINGFSMFENAYPESDCKLILHTNWSEGWDINSLCRDYKLNPQKILTSYICKKCNNYSLKNYSGPNDDCPFCEEKKCFVNISTENGVSEFQLNEIYNTMDIYVHPFTSGGQEIPIQEAKLCELITAVTNYTCGEEMCSPESFGFPLKWSPYREIGTQFIKASTSAESIFDNLKKVYLMDSEEKLRMGLNARNFILKNYSSDVIGFELESILDSMPLIDYSSKNPFESFDLNYIPDINIANNKDFVCDLIKNMLCENPEKYDQKVLELTSLLNDKKVSREKAVDYVKQETEAKKQFLFLSDINNIIDTSSKNKRLSVTIPNSLEFALLIYCFIPEIKRIYSDHDIYIFCDKNLLELIAPFYNIVYKIFPRTEFDEDLSILKGSDENCAFHKSFIFNENVLNSLKNF